MLSMRFKTFWKNGICSYRNRYFFLKKIILENLRNGSSWKEIQNFEKIVLVRDRGLCEWLPCPNGELNVLIPSTQDPEEELKRLS